MTLNKLMADILRITEFDTILGLLRYVQSSKLDPVGDKNVAQRIYFSAIYDLW